MKREFDFYEFTGIILPGLIVLLFVAFANSSLRAALFQDKVGLGDFGILILLSYICGHLLQALSNLWEKALWLPQGGLPTEWLRTKNNKLISEGQREWVETRIPLILNVGLPKGISGVSRKEWSAITSQMYVAVQAAGRTARIDTFNGNYGLLRGCVSAGIIVIILALYLGIHPLKEIIGWALLMMAIACYRTQRFGVHYAKELFLQFAQLDGPPEKGSGNSEPIA